MPTWQSVLNNTLCWRMRVTNLFEIRIDWPIAMGNTTRKNSDPARLPRSSFTLRPISHTSRLGVIKAHDRFVISVTKIATVSSPPALRVHTAADACVLGTQAATIRPPASSAFSSGERQYASRGKKPRFMIDAKIGGHGRPSELRINSIGIGAAIIHMTLNTMVDCNQCAADSGVSDSCATKPVESEINNPIINQFAARNLPRPVWSRSPNCLNPNKCSAPCANSA